jgi:hypothetical protein
MADLETIKSLVWRILNGMPIEIFDEENYAVWENCMWELTDTRDASQGEYSGTRIIGSANILFAYNIVRLKSLKESVDSDYDAELYNLDIFKKVLELLQEDKLIRKKPHKVRETFKVV